jgi:hypothetical protein
LNNLISKAALTHYSAQSIRSEFAFRCIEVEAHKLIEEDRLVCLLAGLCVVRERDDVQIAMYIHRFLDDNIDLGVLCQFILLLY